MGKEKQSRVKRLLKLFLQIISFNTPKIRVFNLSAIFVSLAAVPTWVLDKIPAGCVFKNVIFPIVFRGHCPLSGFFADCECPACGMTHAMSRLLHLDFVGAWDYNRAVFVLFAVMVIVLVMNIIAVHKQKK